MRMPKEQIEIHLKYDGPDVDDGTMSLQDIIPVLQGFASSYGKLAATDDPSSTHRVRITGVRRGSADIVLEVWRALGESANPLTTITIATPVAILIVKKIAGVIRAKRHVKKKPFKEQISSVNANTVVIINSENVTLELPLDIYELFKAGTLDHDLNKIVSPLVKDRINSAELEARSENEAAILKERITAEERPFFETTDVVVTTTGETWLDAKLNSLTKSTNSGYLYLLDGSRTFYRYIGDNPTQLYSIFAYDGPVRIRCIAHMDENLKPTQVDIYDIEKRQGELNFPAPPSTSDDNGD